MQFKHPEILYFLFLLLIPIIVHLFQLRRFQKVDFTNVAFLKKATLQTRKSSQIKKWLTLMARLLALGCMIIAFAQPFTASKTALNTEKETVLFLDNSYSMQAKGPNGPLLARVQQQLFDQLEGEARISWFTNDHTWKQVTHANFRNEVRSVGYAPNQLPWETVFQKAAQLFSESKTAEKRLILVSDFQQQGPLPIIDSLWNVDAVQLKPTVVNNLAIDTAYIVSRNVNSLQLAVALSGTGDVPESTSVSLFKDQTLTAKTAVDFSEIPQNSVTFDIEDPYGFVGTLQIDDRYLQYDNALYFSLKKETKIKVLSINEGEAAFLQNLFDGEAYDYLQERYNTLNFSIIPEQHFIVLNELKHIPVSLVTALSAYLEQGGSICIIPSKEATLSEYNTLLNALHLGSFSEAAIPQEKKITKIQFSHPLYRNVFEKEVTNFQYPTVQSYFPLQTVGSEALQFEDGKPFLVQSGKAYLWTAAFDQGNSNFKNSPLIVPTFINMAQQSLPLPELYYNLGTNNTFAVPVTMGPDDILTLRDSIASYIPLQLTKAQSVEITTGDELSRAGNYEVVHKEQVLETVSFNDNRKESSLNYIDLDQWNGLQAYDSVVKLFDAIADANQLHALWKWFVIFAIAFLMFEMFILKFLQ
ncbi:MAG TPA: BatA domain-containing protein [Flavobacteriaceae bacterium]|nr:BatA domain-containing protein [Flavobacteriaceae bacterium]MCB9213411.1 BatA domain-containing protein [Alteromonas sp.]HPF10305.1 BatA domain-containing protein [Flavobacteriaceae bacterium]HQU20751.1 BatA domain-containing protein [Flavobacteriaceae bacterium]HQU64831.1 BatA domain-containing protein [Flavobacteriaceae bacterium]